MGVVMQGTQYSILTSKGLGAGVIRVGEMDSRFRENDRERKKVTVVPFKQVTCHKVTWRERGVTRGEMDTL